MTPSEVVLALGRTLKEAADERSPGDEYHRGQLLSASSMARHLAAEQSTEAELRRWFCSRLLALLGPAADQAASGGDEELAQQLRLTCRELRQAEDSRDAGDALGTLLGEMGRGRTALDDLRGQIHSLLRELCDREVMALSRAPA